MKQKKQRTAALEHRRPVAFFPGVDVSAWDRRTTMPTTGAGQVTLNSIGEFLIRAGSTFLDPAGRARSAPVLAVDSNH